MEKGSSQGHTPQKARQMFEQAAALKYVPAYFQTGKGFYTAEPDPLTNIERVKFADAHVALDLDGHAGEVAKLLGAVFGAATVANQDYAGIGLTKADEGLSYEQLATFAIDATKLTSHEDIVMLLWQNLFGSAPTESEKSPYVEMLDMGEISTGALAVLAADTGINAENIHLTGLAQTGLAYTG